MSQDKKPWTGTPQPGKLPIEPFHITRRPSPDSGSNTPKPGQGEHKQKGE